MLAKSKELLLQLFRTIHVFFLKTRSDSVGYFLCTNKVRTVGCSSPWSERLLHMHVLKLNPGENSFTLNLSSKTRWIARLVYAKPQPANGLATC